MAPKRPPPIEQPPSASSTTSGSEEEEVEDSQVDESESEEEEFEAKPTQPSLKNPISKPPSTPKPQPSDEEEDDDSEPEKTDPTAESEADSSSDGEEDDDNEPVEHMISHRNNVDVKPISSKLTADPPKSKKPTSIPTPTPKTPSSKPLKRTAEPVKTEKRDRKKKKVSDLGEEDEERHNEEHEKKINSGANEKKPTTGAGNDKNLFQRKWSAEDEIKVLKGMYDFKKKGGNISDFSKYFEYIKDDLVQFDKSQLQSKMKRLKGKYHNKAGKAKPGEDPVFSNPHELQSYQISKKIWGTKSDKDDEVETNHQESDKDDEVETNDRESEEDVKKSKNKVNGVASPKKKVLEVLDSPPKVEAKEKENGSMAEYVYLNESLQSRMHPSMPVPPQGLGEIFAKKGWDSAKNLNAKALDQRWKTVLIAETKAYLERIDLVRDQTKMMLEVLESSDLGA